MSKHLALYYSSNHNITFHNENRPDLVDLPDDWDEYTTFEQDAYLDDLIKDYIYELVEVYYEIIGD